jgi:uncharacterized membrane protein required for colicin V production
VSWVDIVIALVVIAATERGLRVGAIRQLSTTVGFLAGFIVGSLIAPEIASHISSPAPRALTAISIVAVIATLGGVGGREAGNLIKMSARRGTLSRIDRAGGAVAAALGALVACWLAAGLLAGTSAVGLSSAIDKSRILTVVDRVMPPLPTVEAKVQALLRSTDFPSVFADVVAPISPVASLPGLAATRAALGSAAPSVQKVTAFDDCGAAHEGTSFAVAPGEFVTAAHVVAGASHVEVAGHAASVVAFDSRDDVAVLRAPGAGGTGLVILGSIPHHGTPAAVAGYPLNRSFSVAPAAIAGTIEALGRDIYDTALVQRRLVVVTALVQPGNSGSPVLVGGRVAAMVFSRSLSVASTAYAVDPSTITSIVANAGTAPVSTGGCLSG